MKQIITKPAVDVTYSVDQITIDLPTKSAIIRVSKDDSESISQTKVRFEVLPFLQDEGYTESQITGIKTMFRQMVAKAFGIAESELVDTLFPESGELV